MNITLAWNNKIQQHLDERNTYAYLFKQTRPYQSSPFDKLVFLTDFIPTNQCLHLCKTFGQFADLKNKKANRKYLYRMSYSFGPVSILSLPVFDNIPRTKIIINPSEAGLSLGQVVEWVKFVAGTLAVSLRHADAKHDISYPYKDVESRIWLPRYRVAKEVYKDETMYFGSRKGLRETAVYDKAKQKGLIEDRTRVEMRKDWTKKEQPLIPDFAINILDLNPFKDCKIITATGDPLLSTLTMRYGILRQPDSVYKTLKALSPYQRNTVLKALDDAGVTIDLAKEYRKELLSWLFPKLNDMS